MARSLQPGATIARKGVGTARWRAGASVEAHCRALLDPTARRAGAAIHPDPATRGYVWAVVLGG